MQRLTSARLACILYLGFCLAPCRAHRSLEVEGVWTDCPDVCAECCRDYWGFLDMMERQKGYTCVLKDPSLEGIASFKSQMGDLCETPVPRGGEACTKQNVDANCLMDAKCFFDTAHSKKSNVVQQLGECTSKISMCCDEEEDWDEKLCVNDSEEHTIERESKIKGTQQKYERIDQQYEPSSCPEGYKHHPHDGPKPSFPEKVGDGYGCARDLGVTSTADRQKVMTGCCLSTTVETWTHGYMTEYGRRDPMLGHKMVYTYGHKTAEVSWTKCTEFLMMYHCGGLEQTGISYQRKAYQGKCHLGSCPDGTLSSYGSAIIYPKKAKSMKNPHACYGTCSLTMHS